MHTSENKQTTHDTSPAPKKSNKRLILLLAVLILLGIVAAGRAVWQHLQYDQKHQQQIDEQISRLERKLTHANELLDQQAQGLKTLQEASQSLLQKKSDKQDESALLEASYLVRLAYSHLVFENNVSLAKQLLEAADKRTSTISESSTPWALRKALAQDIATLNATSVVDLPGLMARLNTLSQESEKLPETPLPLATKAEDKKTEADNTTEKTETSAIAAQSTTTTQSTLSTALAKLKIFAAAVGHALSEMVIISKNNEKMPVLLTSQERLYVITNIQSQLSLAQLAVIHRQSEIYTQSLSQIENWLHNYFSADDPLVKSMLMSVKDLKKISVAPEVPDNLESLDALNK